MYDIIFVSPKNNQPRYKTLCTKYPTAKFTTSFEQAQRKALSDMFYVVWDDLDVSDTFELEVLILVLPKLPASNRRWSTSRLEFS